MLGCSCWGPRRGCGGCCLACCLVVGAQPLSTMLVACNCTLGEVPKKLCWRAVNGKVSQQRLLYASEQNSVHTALALLQLLQLLQACKGKASHSPLQYLFARAQTYALYIAPGRVAIVTMASELPLLCRVDTTVRHKALLVPCGCQAFEQASAVLLAGCRRKK